MLTGNLGDKLIPQNEILRDVSDLKALANLHESMEWLASRLKTFSTSLPHASSKYGAASFGIWKYGRRRFEHGPNVDVGIVSGMGLLKASVMTRNRHL